MGRLDARGIDVARIFLDAHAAGAGVAQAVAAVTTAAAAKAPVPAPAAKTPAPAPTAPAAASAPATAPGPGADPAVDAAQRRAKRELTDLWDGAEPSKQAQAPASDPADTAMRRAKRELAEVLSGTDPWAPPASTDAKRSWGPLTEGLSVPRDLDLGDRTKALEQLGVNRLAHAAIVGCVKDVLPETEAGLLVGSRQWPLLAHRMDQIRDQGGTGLLASHLARLGTDTSWKEVSGSTTAGRLVDATLHSLTTPPSIPAAPASRVRVSPAAARSRSTTTPAAAAPGQQAPTEAAVPAHRQQTAPARGAGRTR
ncbi:hypothetical protein [Streptomyces sp. LN699]|uniref:hypothetical protein n=1 Tax=Streptomyces sp. LN699 TaxID=3112981 RepID=UPI003721B10C